MQVFNIVVYSIVPCRLPYTRWKEAMEAFPPKVNVTGSLY